MRVIILKTRSSGTWQGSTTDGDLDKADSNTFWIFVDLSDSAISQVDFYVVPDRWMRQNIAEYHAAYLARHGGRRAIAQDSTHHAIHAERISAWRNRWDLLGIPC
jgi:hypothetical protein